MQPKILAASAVAIGLLLGASAHATPARGGNRNLGSFNILTGGSGWGQLGIYFQSAFGSQSGGSGGSYQTLYDGALRSFSDPTPRFHLNWVFGGDGDTGKQCDGGDAGFVPEPGAVGVFSVGLLVAGALIRRMRRPS